MSFLSAAGDFLAGYRGESSCYDYGMRPVTSALGLFVIFLALAEAGAAQEAPKPRQLPDVPVAKQENAPPKHENTLHTTIEILGRPSIFFPDLAASPGPLRSTQKMKLFLGESIAPSRILSSGLSAGIGQAANSLPGYGQGMGGYAERFGSSMATAASAHFFGTFLLPSLLHDDPRYFVALRGSTGYRIKYAISRIVATRTDAGETAVNWPGIIGPLLAESLATSYLPVNEQTAGRTFRRYGVRIGFTVASNVVKEYWPTIFRSLRITKIAPGLGPDPAGTAPPGFAGTRPSP